MHSRVGVGQQAADRHGVAGSAGAGGQRLRDVTRGVASGVLGGLCCLAGAIAVRLGLGGVGFFTSFMGRYQPLFVAASVALLGLWAGRVVHRARMSGGGGLREALRGIAWPVSVMGVTWAVTLVAVLAVGRAAGLG